MTPSKVEKVCLQCGKNFSVWHYREKTAHFCSHKCGSLYKIGKTNTSKTKWVKGQVSWNKGKKCSKETIEKMRQSHLGKKMGENNPRWKGDDIKYGGLHDWVYLRKGFPKKCEHCGVTTAKKFEWANKDHSYKRVLQDYIALCTSCHRKFDIVHNGYRIKGKIPNRQCGIPENGKPPDQDFRQWFPLPILAERRRQNCRWQ